MSEKPTAIVVDDSHAFLMYLSILLNRMNLEVLPVDSAAEALELARVTRPKVMTLDMVMPEMDGLDALRKIREDKDLESLPVIMISSYQDKNRHWEAMSMGCIDVLDKPFDLQRLHVALQRCDLYPGGRRRYLRAPFHQAVVLQCNDKTFHLNSVTLSERGIFVRMRQPLPIGTEVDVCIPLAGDRSLEVGGKVIYVKSLNGGKFVIPPGVAIKFDRLTTEDAGLLSKLVTDQLIGDILAEQEEDVIRPI